MCTGIKTMRTNRNKAIREKKREEEDGDRGGSGSGVDRIGDRGR